MASAEFDDKSQEKRPAVQVGDPFTEKLLLEACLEVMKTGALVGIQDMGAAGLTCSTSEMGSRGGVGIAIDVADVPQRESGMTPYEILLSESQERMLMVVKSGREREVEEIFGKWDLHAVKIGEVTSGNRLVVKAHGAVAADIPNRALTDEAPVYNRPTARPAWLDEVRTLDLTALAPASPPSDALISLLSSPTIASKRWIYRQYDHMVRTNTIALPGATCGIVRVKGTDRALAMSVDGNGRFGYLDPRMGAKLAVAEASRNVACAGGLPIGGTNNLNFGNPERPDIMWQFAEAVAGIGEACRALDIPITGGNVSLYNETDGQPILPTPVLGVVGLVEHADRIVTRTFKGEAAVVLLGTTKSELGGSEYLRRQHGLLRGVPPALDLDAEKRLQQLLVSLAADGLVQSAHDCAEGGLAVTIAECSFDAGGVGADIDVPAVADVPEGLTVDATLFSESASRVVISTTADTLQRVLARAAEHNVPAARIGHTTPNRLVMRVGGRIALDVPVDLAEQAWKTGLERYFTKG
jgi:phosphoribosylformylglycinamidine synthase